jgi:hypothetical protein
MVKEWFSLVTQSPTTLVIFGWLAYVFGCLLEGPMWLKLTVLLVARGLP